MRRLRALGLTAAATVAMLGGAASAGAEEIPLGPYVEELQGLLQNVLQINIRAKVLSSTEQLIWEARKEALTVPGLEVEVRVPSESLVILAFITPERLEEDRILLRVHAEIRPADAPRESTARWSTTVNYIPAVLGDKIRFYPLGEFPDLTQRPSGAAALYNLELEIQIVPYTAPKE